MKIFALRISIALTTVSLLNLSALGSVRPVLALENRQPLETRIVQVDSNSTLD